MNICTYEYLDCMPILGDCHQSLAGIYVPGLRIPSMAWMTINPVLRFDHGIYIYIEREIEIYIDTYEHMNVCRYVYSFIDFYTC